MPLDLQVPTTSRTKDSPTPGDEQLSATANGVDRATVRGSIAVLAAAHQERSELQESHSKANEQPIFAAPTAAGPGATNLPATTPSRGSSLRSDYERFMSLANRHAEALLRLSSTRTERSPATLQPIDKAAGELAHFFGKKSPDQIQIRVTPHKEERGLSNVTILSADGLEELATFSISRRGGETSTGVPSFLAASDPELQQASRVMPFARAMAAVDYAAGEKAPLTIAMDPSLRHTPDVARILLKEEGSIGFKGEIPFEFAERCARISRSLHYSGEQPSAGAVERAEGRIEGALTRSMAAPAFKGRSILVGAHEEQQRRPSMDSHHRFGQTKFLAALSAQGPEALEVVRPRSLREALPLWAKQHANTFIKGTPAERDGATKALVNIVEPDERLDLSFTVEFSPKGDLLRVKARKGEREVLKAELPTGGRQGEPATIVLSKDLADLSPAAARDLFLKRVADTQPGPNGFTCVFDGHGASRGLFFSRGLRGENHDFTDCVRPDKLAAALAERARRFPNEPAPLLILASCDSGTYGQILLKECSARGVPSPQLLLVAEHEQPGYTYPGFSASALAELFIAVRKGNPKKTISVGEIGQTFRKKPSFDNLAPVSNPILFLPDNNGKPVQVSQAEDHAAPRPEASVASTPVALDGLGDI